MSMLILVYFQDYRSIVHHVPNGIFALASPADLISEIKIICLTKEEFNIKRHQLHIKDDLSSWV